MRLNLRIGGDPGGRETPVDIISEGPICRFRMLGDGSPDWLAEVEQPEPGIYSVLLEGRSYEARVEAGDGYLLVVIDGERFEIELRDPRRWDRRGAGRGLEGRQSVVAPMPGKVVRLLVAAGDTVEAGQGLLVVEAMKMQNEMKAIKGGRVVTLSACEGKTVAVGEVLAIIE